MGLFAVVLDSAGCMFVLMLVGGGAGMAARWYLSMFMLISQWRCSFMCSCIRPRASARSCVRAFVCSCARAFVRSCARASVRLCIRAALCSCVRPFVAVFVGIGGWTAAAVHLFVLGSLWSVVGLLFLLSFVCPWLYSPVWNPFVSCTC